MSMREADAAERFEADKGAAEMEDIDNGDEDTVVAMQDDIQPTDIAFDVAFGGSAIPAPDNRAAEQMEGDGAR